MFDVEWTTGTTSPGPWYINNYQQLDHWGPANDCIWV